MNDAVGGQAAIELRAISKSYGIGGDRHVRAADGDETLEDICLDVAERGFPAWAQSRR